MRGQQRRRLLVGRWGHPAAAVVGGGASVSGREDVLHPAERVYRYGWGLHAQLEDGTTAHAIF